MSYVTLPYPLKPVEAPPEYRGKPVIDPNICIGCGACSRACPPDAISVEDDGVKGVRRVRVDVSRCIRCARCEEVCPTGAMKLTREFELASPDKGDMIQVVELKLARCSLCGRPTNYTERQVRMAKEILKHLPPDLLDEFAGRMTLCPKCRSLKTTEYLVLTAGLSKNQYELRG